MKKQSLIDKSIEKHGNLLFSFDSVPEEFNYNEEITLFCLKHQKSFQQRVSNHCAGSTGCSECILEKKTQKTRLTKAQFEEKARKVHLDEYDYTNSNYVSMHDTIEILHKRCGKTFSIVPHAHINQKQGCRSCNLLKRTANKLLLEAERVLAYCNDKYGQLFIYPPKEEYKGNNTKHDIFCTQCGKWLSQTFKQHKKNGCYFCNGRGVNKHTPETFKEKASLVHSNTYDYSLIINILNIREELPIICHTHGVFKQAGYIHLNGSGCPKCNGGVSYTPEVFEKLVGDIKPSLKVVTPSHEQITISCPKHGEFKQLTYLVLQTKNSCYRCALESHSSLLEAEIREFFKDYKIELHNVLQIDLYFPEYKLGIEVHGNYFHTEHFVGRTLHKTKADLANKAGITLLQIYETEWRDKQEIVLSRIRSKLGIGTKIHARNTDLIELSNKEARSFLERNHLQGGINSQYNYGLRYREEIVMVMTFGRPRFNKNFDFELLRCCTKVGWRVKYGASKLLGAFKKGSIITYSDRRWSSGGFYEKLGFKQIAINDPGFNYYHIKSKKLYSRHFGIKLKENNSEYNTMLAKGFDRIWDAGIFVYGYNP